jgi:hypothetical protein
MDKFIEACKKESESISMFYDLSTKFPKVDQIFIIHYKVKPLGKFKNQTA